MFSTLTEALFARLTGMQKTIIERDSSFLRRIPESRTLRDHESLTKCQECNIIKHVMLKCINIAGILFTGGPETFNLQVVEGTATVTLLPNNNIEIHSTIPADIWNKLFSHFNHTLFGSYLELKFPANRSLLEPIFVLRSSRRSRAVRTPPGHFLDFPGLYGLPHPPAAHPLPAMPKAPPAPPPALAVPPPAPPSSSVSSSSSDSDSGVSNISVQPPRGLKRTAVRARMEEDPFQ